jgi:hypothetical protein
MTIKSVCHPENSIVPKTGCTAQWRENGPSNRGETGRDIRMQFAELYIKVFSQKQAETFYFFSFH